MKTANLNAVKELQSHNVTREIERVKKRLQVLVNEEKEYSGGSGAPVSVSKGSESAQTKSSAGTSKKNL